MEVKVIAGPTQEIERIAGAASKELKNVRFVTSHLNPEGTWVTVLFFYEPGPELLLEKEV